MFIQTSQIATVPKKADNHFTYRIWANYLKLLKLD